MKQSDVVFLCSMIVLAPHLGITAGVVGGIVFGIVFLALRKRGR